MDDGRAASLASLKDNAAFRELTDELAAAEEKYWGRFLARVKSGEIVKQAEISYMLAKFDAARAITAQPEKAAKQLERDAEKAAAAKDVEDNPYAA